MLSGMLWMGADGYAQPSAHVTGSVTDTTGLPLAGATITLRGASDRVTQTDSEGQFDVQSLPEGEYELTATLPGFAPARQTARLASAQRLHISLTLTVLILERTVVTAARTGEADVQNIPMAVSVLPADELARMQDHTVEHIAGRAPGVTFSQNTGRAQVTIRGIGTNSVLPGSDPSSACVSRWRVPGAAGHGARGFSGSRPGRSASRPSGDALWPEQPRRRHQSDHEATHERQGSRVPCQSAEATAPFAPTRG